MIQIYCTVRYKGRISSAKCRKNKLRRAIQKVQKNCPHFLSSFFVVYINFFLFQRDSAERRHRLALWERHCVLQGQEILVLRANHVGGRTHRQYHHHQHASHCEFTVRQSSRFFSVDDAPYYFAILVHTALISHATMGVSNIR